jgi:hypothetical protein
MAGRRGGSPVSRLVKALTRASAAHRVLSWLISRYARFVIATSRWTYIGIDTNLDAFLRAGRRAHVLLWHNRILLMPFAWRFPDFELTVLISDHRDGRLVARVLDAAGVNHMRVPASALGERNAFGHTALKAATAREIRRLSASGQTISVIGDGPTGPRFVLKPFVIDLARLCEVEIVLVTYAVRRRLVAKSWDRLVVPLPFNEGIFRAATFSYDPRGLDAGGREALRQRIETDLRAFTDETDRMMGHAPIDR